MGGKEQNKTMRDTTLASLPEEAPDLLLSGPLRADVGQGQDAGLGSPLQECTGVTEVH